MPTTGTPRSPKKPQDQGASKPAARPAAKPIAASRKTPSGKKSYTPPPVATKGRPTKAMAAEAQTLQGQRITRILDLLDELYPDAHCELDFRNAYELLVAVILSAQCTDERVNKVTPALFERYPDPAALLASDVAELEELIRSTGFFRNKAKNLRGAAKKIVEKFGGEVPRTMAELLTLPGVARKTGNVVLGTAYGIPSGVVVDTHIGRLSQRLGMTREQDPVKIENDLMELWPKERWIMSGHRLIWHGRRVCFARKPSCGTCTLAPHCPSVGHALDVPSGETPKRRAP